MGYTFAVALCCLVTLAALLDPAMLVVVFACCRGLAEEIISKAKNVLKAHYLMKVNDGLSMAVPCPLTIQIGTYAKELFGAAFIVDFVEFFYWLS